MLPLHLLLQVKTVVSHANCADGLASAMIIKDVLPDATFLFVSPGMKTYTGLVAEPGMLFVDCVPEAHRVQEFLDVGALVLDHHVSVKDTVLAFGENGVYSSEEEGHSGATLAYFNVWKPLYRYQESELLINGTVYNVAEREAHLARVHRLAHLAEIRDTWKKTHPDWQESRFQTEALHYYPRDIWMGVPIGSLQFDSMMSIGAIQARKFDERVGAALKESFWFDCGGKRFVVVAGTSITSEASEMVGDKADALIGWAYRLDGPAKFDEGGFPKLQLSVRSRGTFDCAKFTEMLGGGGHVNAAGVVTAQHMKSSNVFDTIMNMVAHFLGV